MKFTVFGSTGFIGSHLVNYLDSLNINVDCPLRDADIKKGTQLGNVIYCIGLTSDFRKKPFETIEAHVCKLKQVLQDYEFDSFVYLSSTRIYIHNEGTVSEDSLIPVLVTDPFDLFNSSKLTGELLTLNCGKKNVKVARLSNVYGNDFTSGNFVISLIKDALQTGKIVLRTTADSAKDYIGVNDVAKLLYDLSLKNGEGVYNLASGTHVTNKEILDIIQQETHCTIEFSPTAERIVFPMINADKIKTEFGFSQSGTLLTDLKKIISGVKASLNTQH